MKIELINTGSELMLGFVLNTHQQWLCRQLADLGFQVTRQTAIPDEPSAIQAAVRESLGRADVVITTGGLGPTSDDLTRDYIAQLLGKPLHEDAQVLAQIESFFANRLRSMPVTTRVQAMVPEGALVLPNLHGTAPGLAMEVPAAAFRSGTEPGLLIMLPGPPRELRPMFSDQVVPLLHKRCPHPNGFSCRVLKSTGLGESFVEQKIAPLLEPLVKTGLQIGYCARVGEVDIRLVARGKEAIRCVAEAEHIVSTNLAHLIFSDNEDPLERVVVRLLTEKKKTLILAESCTGGFISNRITNVPGASEVFAGGLLTYSNLMKQEILGVGCQTLEKHGAVSEETAREMAIGARVKGKTDYSISVTGIAGPSGGSSEKPVGTVYIGISDVTGTTVKKCLNQYDRETFKYLTSQQALEILRRRILQLPAP